MKNSRNPSYDHVVVSHPQMLFEEITQAFIQAQVFLQHVQSVHDSRLFLTTGEHWLLAGIVSISPYVLCQRYNPKTIVFCVYEKEYPGDPFVAPRDSIGTPFGPLEVQDHRALFSQETSIRSEIEGTDNIFTLTNVEEVIERSLIYQNATGLLLHSALTRALLPNTNILPIFYGKKGKQKLLPYLQTLYQNKDNVIMFLGQLDEIPRTEASADEFRDSFLQGKSFKKSDFLGNNQFSLALSLSKKIKRKRQELCSLHTSAVMKKDRLMQGFGAFYI